MRICGLGAGSGPRLRASDFLPQFTRCCYGASIRGARDCTCWVPIFDMVQQRADPSIAPTTRSAMCGDCAYRPESPERRADPYALLDLAVFWCHRGMRRPREWRHPDGRARPGYDGDYQPLMVGAVPYRADGRPAARCGGWAAQQRTEAVA